MVNKKGSARLIGRVEMGMVIPCSIIFIIGMHPIAWSLSVIKPPVRGKV